MQKKTSQRKLMEICYRGKVFLTFPGSITKMHNFSQSEQSFFNLAHDMCIGSIGWFFFLKTTTVERTERVHIFIKLCRNIMKRETDGITISIVTSDIQTCFLLVFNFLYSVDQFSSELKKRRTNFDLGKVCTRSNVLFQSD